MNKRKKSRFWTCVIALIFVYSSYTVYGLTQDLNAKKAESNAIQSKIDAEIAQNEQLMEQLKTVKTDEYIEKIAREKLGLVKSGEKVFVDINR
jgi:cell division protein FtsB